MIIKSNQDRSYAYFFLQLFVLFQVLIVKVVVTQNTNVIESWHFHTYFFPTESSVLEALKLRNKIEKFIHDGVLRECRTNTINFHARTPHLLPQFEVCCNSTSLNEAMSFFTQNRGNLSVLFHPLTRYELLDHTARAMFLGDVIKLNTSILSVDLFDDVDHCLDDEIEEIDPELLI